MAQINVSGMLKVGKLHDILLPVRVSRLFAFSNATYETTAFVDGWSNIRVAGAFTLRLLYKTRPSFRAPSEVKPACMSGVSGSTSVPTVYRIASLTAVAKLSVSS